MRKHGAFHQWRAWLSVWAWMMAADAIYAQQARRAEVIEDERPAVPRAVPVNPDGSVPRAAEVRDAPQRAGPDEDLFNYGTMLYERGEYALAMKSYSNYMQAYPGGRHIGTALFRIGECLVKEGREAEAARYYEEVVRNHAKSDGAPSAAYRLGAMRFNARDFQGSVNYFNFAEKNTKTPQVALAAAYNLSRGYQMLNRPQEQMAALQRVIAVKVDNPYRDTALLTLAKHEMESNNLNQALKMYQDLMASAGDPKVRAEATVSAAVLLGELKRPEESSKLFEQALALGETAPEKRGIALVGVVQALYDKGDYNGVIDHYTRNSSALPPGVTRGKMLLLVANAYRMKKTYSRAVELYLMIEQDYPQEDVAFEAGYWKLYCFYLLEDKDLGDFATGFLSRWSKKKAGHEFIAKAALIRADHYFNRGEYEQATGAFSEVDMDSLQPDLRASVLYQQGYALIQVGRQQEAIASLTRFLNENTNHEQTSNALVHRGLAYKEIKDYAKARQDFKRITTEFGKSSSAELAWYQLGVIAGLERDPAAKIQAFENLVKLYPQSQAVPQAWFGIGSAAFEKEDWPKAQEALRRAMRLDPKAYTDRAGQMLITSYYAQEDAEGLAAAIDEFQARRPEADLSPTILGWLGLTLFAQDDFKRAARYLKLATTEEPENTISTIWNYLGMAQVETGEHKDAIISLNHYLDSVPQPGPERGKALLYRARAELGLGEHDTALATADEALGFIKTGRLHAELLIAEGDIHFDRARKMEGKGQTNLAIDEFRKAAAKFIVPAQFFVDPKITPEAVWKTILALEKAGDVDRARVLRKELEEKYPGYKPPKQAFQGAGTGGRFLAGMDSRTDHGPAKISCAPSPFLIDHRAEDAAFGTAVGEQAA